MCARRVKGVPGDYVVIVCNGSLAFVCKKGVSVHVFRCVSTSESEQCIRVVSCRPQECLRVNNSLVEKIGKNARAQLLYDNIVGSPEIRGNLLAKL